MAQQIMASLQAHIAEHLGFSYRAQIEERLGVPLPAPDEELPEDMEVQLARLVADAGKQLAQQHQQQAAQQQAQQQAQDPLFQLEQAKVDIQKSDVQRKAQKDAADIKIAQDKVLIEKAKASAQFSQEDKRLTSQDTQAKSKLKLDALKALSTPKNQPKPPGVPPRKE
jgi:hypothetical protein